MIHLEGRGTGWAEAPTVLEGGVLHPEGAVALVGDVGVGVGARRVDDADLDVVSRQLAEGAAVDDEVGGDVPQNACRREEDGLVIDFCLGWFFIREETERVLPLKVNPCRKGRLLFCNCSVTDLCLKTIFLFLAGRQFKSITQKLQ